MASEQVDSEEFDLREAIIERLERNGTLNRIQAELRAAIFLAIEENENTEELQRVTSYAKSLEYALVYNFL
uniref:Uncharacterized protein n=1 Tax=Parascaris equorum TaxID=6256 RepID=A0A914R6D2_PAREQ